jgi:small subunit ribosomal protein S20
MPITKSAVKALKQSKVRQARNLVKKRALKNVVKKTTKPEDLAQAQSKIDRIAKTGYIHKNKASRIKSRLAKRVASSK